MNSPLRRFLPLLLLCSGWHPYAAAQTPQDQTVESAIKVLDEIMTIPNSQIPQSLLSDAAGIAIFPNVVKGGFVLGLRHGRGVILVRDEQGQWHPPIFASLTGGSVGWQAGLQSTDVILVFKSRRSVAGLMNGKLTIGADAAAAAGPVGRQAAVATDERLGAEILSYSRSRGLFAGVSIDGSALQLDHVGGSEYYRRPTIAANGESVVPLDTLPASAIHLINRLAQYTDSPRIVPTDADGNPQAAIATAPPETEKIRHELVIAWQRLSPLLDDRWTAYLEPPPETRVPAQIASLESLRAKLQNYSAINADERYAALNNTPEFGAVYQLLQEYVKARTPDGNPKLTLPPPPPTSSRPTPRY